MKVKMSDVNKGIIKFLSKIEKIIPKKEIDPRLQTRLNKNNNHLETIEKLIKFITSGSVFWGRYDPSYKIHKLHMDYCNHNVYSYLYLFLLNKYKTLVGNEPFKVQSTDTKFIKNINGVEGVDRNPHYNNKNGFKISVEIDSNGIWFSLIIGYASESDYKIYLNNLDNRLIHVNTLKAKNSNKHKQYLMRIQRMT